MSVLGVHCRKADEAGMSLVEVIIYSALSALLLSVLGGVFYTGFQTQAAAGLSDAATKSAQLVTTSLQTGVRGASSILVSEKVLKARVAKGTTDWQCSTWALTTDNKLVYKTSPAAITDTNYSTWAILAVGVTGNPAFAPGTVASSPPAGGVVDTQVKYSLTFTSGKVTVPVAGAVTVNAFGTGVPELCWPS